MMLDILPGAIDSLVNGDHGAPFQVLGPHAADDQTISIRALRPTAKTLTVVDDSSGAQYPMSQMRGEGFFAVEIPGDAATFRYHYEAVTYDGRTETFADPYAFPPLLSDFDLYLFSEGKYLLSYEKFGAHPTEIDGVQGVSFAVWAPNAYKVSVIGSFNHWDKRMHPMRLHEGAGLWELFIPEAKAGDSYRYEIRSRYNGYRAEKSDPYGFFSERRPSNASVVAELEGYEWGDTAWMEARAKDSPLGKPMSIYEIHPGSWRRHEDGSWLNWHELADELVAYLKDVGYTHVELMPVAEHPLDASWGYQVTGYYAPTSRYGTPKDFMYFVDTCHQNGIGVILDWVPAHFPKDGHALTFFDGTALYEHADPRQSEHPDWGTYIFNYGRNEVRNFLISNALYWLHKYHVDGLRVDAVSSMLYLDFSRKAGEWIPNRYGGNENLEAIDFLRQMNTLVHAEAPGAVTIAEESTAFAMVSRPIYLGGLGFTLKWNMGWMHDTLAYMEADPVYRRWKHNQMTFSLAYAFSENFVLALSHDEVVHGKGSLIRKMAGDNWQKFASLRLLTGYQITHPGKKLMFMGHEIAQWKEWSEERQLDWNLLDDPNHRQMQAWVRDLHRLYKAEPALYEYDFDWKGFQWIEANDADQSVFSYMRFAIDRSDFLVVASNFTPVVRHGYRVGVPKDGFYREVLNSDSALYGGSNIGNDGGRHADARESHHQPYSLSLTLPPLGIVVLKLEQE